MKVWSKKKIVCSVFGIVVCRHNHLTMIYFLSPRVKKKKVNSCTSLKKITPLDLSPFKSINLWSGQDWAGFVVNLVVSVFVLYSNDASSKPCWSPNFFSKMFFFKCANIGLFVYFRPIHITISIIQIEKSVDGVVGILAVAAGW